ncbi:MAG: anhydro-N-acetylmuramic acid kinase [Oxalobacteraceae bacterium]|nr:anhydro-N-acetylmuramic acid kinase [Oxalobacteraceae bacterium]
MPLFIGLMSGTSLDGADGVLAVIDEHAGHCQVDVLAAAHVDFPADLRHLLLALQHPGADDLHHEALAANQLATCYASCVHQLLASAGITPDQVAAIGAHGQTIRHRPELGYTRQTNNGALLAELTGINVIVDFRSRDIAAGGHGAPLVPAFHQRLFATDGLRVIANIGGISNISILSPQDQLDATTTGFDTGPGNMLLDLWISRHRGEPYDNGGAWAATGAVHRPLLTALRGDPFFQLAGPKSTGRDLFNAQWLDAHLAGFGDLDNADVQATLVELTASTLIDALVAVAPDVDGVFVCGGGACNAFLMARLQATLSARGSAATVQSTMTIGVPPDQVEALAFAWLALRFMAGATGNLPAVTGARGTRILGALYPA